MDAEEFKEDVLSGRIGVDRLVDLVLKLTTQLQATRHELQQATHELEQAKRRIEELEKELGRSPTQKLDEPFSVEAEEQRQAARKKTKRKKTIKSRRGRISKKDKIALAVRTEAVYPAGVPKDDCQFSHTRPVWRLENGRAVIVAYDVYRGPKSRYGRIPGVIGKGEFGIEIMLAVAYQVYVVDLSFDKVCQVLGFFQNLDLKKSQAEALVKQLAKHWEGEFDVLCQLVAHSAVVHTDETSWSINSVWAFLSEQARVVLFGVHKDGDTLAQILDPATFEGIVISDDAAVYANFTHAQKCWAHLLRKAIKLTLLEPDEPEYRRFTDELLAIYRRACRVQRDGRLSDAGRQRKVAELDDEILELCWPAWKEDLPPLEGTAGDYRLLVNELMRLMLKQQLFAFVTAAPVESPNGDVAAVPGTNNAAERELRAPANARKTGRTNKTVNGARRRTVIVSVLGSLRRHLETYTLSSVIEEVRRWSKAGQSCFSTLREQLGLPPPDGTLLDRLLPTSSD